MSNLIDYAKAELARINKGGDKMQNLMDKCVLDIIQVFNDQGHSGFSASYLINRVERLMRFLPITPLQGTDDEWGDCGRERDSTPIFQNKRCSRVFKDGVGACDVEAEVFSDNGGITWFTRGGHRVYIDFPYMPPTKPKYTYLSEDGERVLTDEAEIKALHDKKRAEFDAVKWED